MVCCMFQWQQGTTWSACPVIIWPWPLLRDIWVVSQQVKWGEVLAQPTVPTDCRESLDRSLTSPSTTLPPQHWLGTATNTSQDWVRMCVMRWLWSKIPKTGPRALMCAVVSHASSSLMHPSLTQWTSTSSAGPLTHQWITSSSNMKVCTLPTVTVCMLPASLPLIRA